MALNKLQWEEKFEAACQKLFLKTIVAVAVAFSRWFIAHAKSRHFIV